MNHSNEQKSKIEVLNDLIQIQNDRILGYEKAIDTVENMMLKEVFVNMKATSHRHRAELTELINSFGGEVEEGTSLGGKLYQLWMDIKSTFTSNSSEHTLESCVFGEDAAQKAYDMALNSEHLCAQAVSVVTRQQNELKADQVKIKALELASQ